MVITRTIEVICSFEELEQVILTLDFEKDPSEITKELLLCRVKDDLENDEKTQLTKLSCCQMMKTDDEPLLPFLAATNGKFFM